MVSEVERTVKGFGFEGSRDGDCQDGGRGAGGKAAMERVTNRRWPGREYFRDKLVVMVEIEKDKAEMVMMVKVK